MRGILFTPENHRAIREGRKTVTRRVITKSSSRIGEDGDYALEDNERIRYVYSRIKPGDTLYIKEAFKIHSYAFPHWADIDYKDGGSQRFDWNEWLNANTRYGGSTCGDEKWRSPLFMPGWAARDFIRIVSVKPEGLQEITLDGIEAEGIIIPESLLDLPDHKGKYLAIQQLFIDLWDSINTKHPWSANPWVWRIEFEYKDGDRR